jgi:hypothetical protein
VPGPEFNGQHAEASREAAKEYSPRRKPWVSKGDEIKPRKGAKETIPASQN